MGPVRAVVSHYPFSDLLHAPDRPTGVRVTRTKLSHHLALGSPPYPSKNRSTEEDEEEDGDEEGRGGSQGRRGEYQCLSVCLSVSQFVSE